MELIEYTLSVRGMRCGMCESHIQDVIRRNFDVVKVKANRHKKEVQIISKIPFDESKLTEVMNSTGYPYLGIIDKKVVIKKGLKAYSLNERLRIRDNRYIFNLFVHFIRCAFCFLL